MTLRLVSADTDALPVTLAEAKDHCRVDTSDDDTLITSLIKTARDLLDGHRGYLGRAIRTQTCDLFMDHFPPRIRIPLPPLQSVLSIQYVDTNGTTQTLGTSLYEVFNCYEQPSYIDPAYGESWPGVRTKSQAVQVRFICGYEAGGSPADSIPEDLKHAILMMICHWYENREHTVLGLSIKELPLGTQDLLSTHQVHWFA